MPRQSRKPSDTGIYHVMMRGINHQTIFEDEEDNYQFINTLDRMRVRYDDEGNACGRNCCYYAYCLMGNHFHLLIRERDERVIIGSTVATDTCSKSASKASPSTTWPTSPYC